MKTDSFTGGNGRATIKAIEDAEKRKILIGSTSEIHPNVPIKNAMAMYETARSYRLS